MLWRKGKGGFEGRNQSDSESAYNGISSLLKRGKTTSISFWGLLWLQLLQEMPRVARIGGKRKEKESAGLEIDVVGL